MTGELVVRHPGLADAAAVHRLIRDTPGLDTNSAYLYALLCRDFADTCAVAVADGALAGVLTGYLRPADPGTYFAWQTAIAPAATHPDIAVRLYDLVLAAAAHPIERIEMSVDASNRAVKFLLSRLAKRYGAARTTELLFSTEQLGGDHYPETLHTLHLPRAAEPRVAGG
ncbi:GNAT family N-acetyltransferase [Nocardia sp. NPDC050697]|uniref:GNAT family N-acetyltransferase n=1 Tax=Nocardia sp. NPDC050697 TaxID=3155158 RepID=UPI0033FA14DB